MINKLKKELTLDEGKRNDIYLDHLGYKTVGIGHLIKPSDPEYKMNIGDIISDERIDELFRQDIENTLKDCRIVFKDWESFVEELRLILANMMFNLGRLRFLGFRKMILAIENKKFEIAAEEMEDSKWFKQVPNRAKRLQKRMINLQQC